MLALFITLLCGAALVPHVVAGVRIPTIHLVTSHVWVLSGYKTSELVARADGCPVGWAPCSLTTCYPLDGSECCSNGNFCPAGYVCQDGGCCPFGEICVGSSGPPITIGGGDDPTETETFIPTTTHHTTTTRRISTSTTTTFDGTTKSDVFTSATAPATARTATTGTGAESTTTPSSTSASIGSGPTGDASNTPLSGAVNGAARTVRNLGMTAMLALLLGIAMQFA